MHWFIINFVTTDSVFLFDFSLNIAGNENMLDSHSIPDSDDFLLKSDSVDVLFNMEAIDSVGRVRNVFFTGTLTDLARSPMFNTGATANYSVSSGLLWLEKINVNEKFYWAQFSLLNQNGPLQFLLDYFGRTEAVETEYSSFDGSELNIPKAVLSDGTAWQAEMNKKQDNFQFELNNAIQIPE